MLLLDALAISEGELTFGLSRNSREALRRTRLWKVLPVFVL